MAAGRRTNEEGVSNYTSRFEGAMRQSCLALNKMVLKREKGSLLARECFFRPGASVHIDHSALISLFPSLHHEQCLPARTAVTGGDGACKSDRGT